MKQKIEVRSQAELDACVKAENFAICVSGKFVLTGKMFAVLRGSSSAVLRGSSSAVLRGSSSAELWESSSAVLLGSSSAVLRESSSAVLLGSSSAVLWGSSSAELRESSSAVLWGSSSAVASGNAFLRIFSALKITATAHVVILLHGKAKTITGGKKIKAHKPKTPLAWCKHRGVNSNNGVAVLYKAVNDDYKSPHGTSYAPGSVPVANDWDGGKAECGGGLHFSPSPAAARNFHFEAKRYVACSVALKDIAVHPDGDYPEKIKAKGCCGPCVEVDKKGNPI